MRQAGVLTILFHSTDQNEGKRHGVSKGLKRVVSDIDVTRKHRNTISNMTLSDINLGCTTAGSISTVSSTSSTTTSISESASLSPASSVFGVGSKQPDANIRTYASRGRGRRGRPPTRCAILRYGMFVGFENIVAVVLSLQSFQQIDFIN